LTSFLRWFRTTWLGSFLERFRSLAEAVSPDEQLSRYLTQSSHFSRENNRVKPAAFMPAPNGRTSIFRTLGLSGRAIWRIGEEVCRRGGRPLHGRADILAQEITAARLKIEPDDRSSRHANITGWPPEKSEKMSLAQGLAARASLYLRT